MTARNGQRETEISRTLDRVGRSRPLILTPEDREVVAMRLRELKREVIPPLLRVMQSPYPDASERESYQRRRTSSTPAAGDRGALGEARHRRTRHWGSGVQITT
jgi:hypothetical protein